MISYIKKNMKMIQKYPVYVSGYSSFTASGALL